jgi:methylenetetrahydrofolate dehydrogenase (NADP+)/methenyltetrahydrofolate cyclohydrolase
MARIIRGRELFDKLKVEYKKDIAALQQEHNIVPGLAVVLVGDNPASLSYVRLKEKACAEIGIHSRDLRFDKEFTEDALLKLIDELNHDASIHGILVQLPLPDHIDEAKVLYAIDPLKDVDGFHPVNAGRLLLGEPAFYPATPLGIQQLILHNNIPIEGKHVVIVGRSNIVGKPLAMLLVQKQTGANATVTICHTRTKDLAAITRTADILIAAVGRPHTVTADMVKEGTVVIDVGVNRVEDATKKSGYRLVGDVDFQEVEAKASVITPVPGGVGPMTIAMLLYNVIKAAKDHACRQ